METSSQTRISSFSNFLRLGGGMTVGKLAGNKTFRIVFTRSLSRWFVLLLALFVHLRFPPLLKIYGCERFVIKSGMPWIFQMSPYAKVWSAHSAACVTGDRSMKRWKEGKIIVVVDVEDWNSHYSLTVKDLSGSESASPLVTLGSHKKGR